MNQQKKLLYMLLGMVVSVGAIVGAFVFLAPANAFDDTGPNIFLPIANRPDIGQASEEQSVNAAEQSQVDQADHHETPVPPFRGYSYDEFPITPLPTSTNDYEETKKVVEEIEANQTYIDMAGPNTRGQTYIMGGKEIKLPEDTELNGQIIAIDCIFDPITKRPPETCPKAPLLQIKRGDYQILVEINTGRIHPNVAQLARDNNQYIGAFQFLIDILGEDKIVRKP